MSKRIMPKRLALVTTALMLAIGAAGSASAATKHSPAAHPRTQASLQCSADANAKGLHGKARVAFRRDCLHKASSHKAAYQMPTRSKHAQPASTHKKLDKVDKKV